MWSKVLFIFVLAGIGRGDGPKQLSVTVLYESKCPDSRSFVLRQLQQAMVLLRDQVQLTLVPFGKADSVDSGYGGFQCQHGPPECQGNIVQDCALSLMANRDDLEKTAYVACEMSTLAGTEGSLMCVQKANVSSAAVSECISSGRGTLLQLHSERVTKQYRPKFIPTVIINGVFNQHIQDMSQFDLIGTLCALLRQKGNCADIYNNNALQYVLG
ncbi:GILT-like protein 1 isoform X2 [Plodia interpunctella]|uniref:GILT-like protein 1 isoform X2 n=1 Tax=Plodia interpunctella TaxID=58824 RepID=UPI00236872D0|nr:GILT-like protein 1 isoform X2 [Plodia interpunctella]